MPSRQLVVKLWMLTFGYLPTTEHKTKQQNYQIRVYAFAKCLKNQHKTNKPCVNSRSYISKNNLSLSICPLKISLLWNKNKTVVYLYICLLIQSHEGCELCTKSKTLFWLKWPLSWGVIAFCFPWLCSPLARASGPISLGSEFLYHWDKAGQDCLVMW